MEVNSIQNYYRAQAAATSASAKKTAEDCNTPASDTRGTDTVDISSEASFKAELSRYSRTYAVKNNEKASSERISELKQQYKGDACPISGSDIAAKIIAGILGPSVKD